MSRRLGVFAADERMRVTSWDAWMEKATGIGEAAARGRELGELLPRLAERGALGRLRRVISDGVVEVLSEGLHRDLFPKGPAGAWRATAAPLRREGKVVGLIFLIEERTELDELKDPDWQVRRKAVIKLARRGDAASVEALLRTLQEDYRDLGVVNSALQVLGMLDLDLTEPLCRLATSAKPDLRMYAITALGDHGDRRAAACLLRSLDDPDANVRFHALEALGKLRAAEAVPRLVALARAGDFFLAFPALDALAAIGDARVVPELEPLLDDPRLRSPAARVLGELGDEGVVGGLAGLLSGPDCVAAAEALSRLYDRHERAYGEGGEIAAQARRRAPAAAAAELARQAKEARGAALKAVTRVLGWLDGPEVERALDALLAEPDARREAVEALASRGRRAAASLRRHLQDADPEALKDSIAALGRLGDRESVPELIGLLSSDSDTAILVMEALAKIGDPRSMEAILPLLDHPSGSVRVAAVAALNSLGRPELESRAGALLRSPSPRERQSAVRIAGYFGWPSAFHAVLQAAREDPDPETRKAALEVLPFFEKDEAPRTLARAARDPDAGVRAAAARGLAHLPAEQAAASLALALQDADQWVRYHAARASGALRLAGVAARLASLAESDPSVPVRAAAAEALGRAGGPEVADRLARLTMDPEPDVVRAAFKALTARRDARAVAAILKHAAQVPETLDDAIDALSSMGTGDAADALVKLAAESDRGEACAAALARAGDAALPALSRGLKRPEVRARRTVVAALRRIKTDAASGLLNDALSDRDAAVRADAAVALGELGGADDRALAELARLDPDPSVRQAASYALRPRGP